MLVLAKQFDTQNFIILFGLGWGTQTMSVNLMHPFFSYVRVIQNHTPTPVRNSKYLAIPPTYPFTLT